MAFRYRYLSGISRSGKETAPSPLHPKQGCADAQCAHAHVYKVTTGTFAISLSIQLTFYIACPTPFQIDSCGAWLLQSSVQTAVPQNNTVSKALWKNQDDSHSLAAAQLLPLPTQANTFKQQQEDCMGGLKTKQVFEHGMMTEKQNKCML